MNRKIINIPFKGYKTHTVIYGDVTKNTPIIFLHGGPGGCIEKYEPFVELAMMGIPCIFYDQLGCGYSRVPKSHLELWTMETFEDELENIISYLGLKHYIVLGHSWGGMLALNWVTTRKHIGLEKLILFSTLPSTRIWNDEHIKMIDNFKNEYKEALINQYLGKPFDTKNYKLALKEFYNEHVGKKSHKRYVYSRKRFPKTNKEIYEYMWGPSELFGTGTLVNYNVENDLEKVDVPTLVLSGAFDESTPAINELMQQKIPNSKWVLLELSHHIGYAEETPLVMKTIIDFYESN